MTIDKAIEVLKACVGGCGDCHPCAEHDEAIALAVKGLLVLRSANSLFAGSDALVQEENREEEKEKLPDLPTIGERIRCARKVKKVKQEDVAKAIGVNRATISKYESGALELSAEMASVIADTLNVDVAWLIGANHLCAGEASETIGDRIYVARRNAYMTQAQLGAKLGVSNSMVAQYETGSRKPKFETVKKIADALECDPYWLLTGKEGNA